MQADSRKIISENIVADRSKLKIICVFLHRIYFGRIPYERQYRGKKRKAMNITELQQSYASHPNVEGVCRLLKDNSVRHLYCGGLYASAASLFSSVLVQWATCPLVFILGDMEEAGYFYHDLTQILGTEQVLFFPSSFRRAIKYGQKDAANEILRTEVLSRLQKGEEGLCVVTYPDALAEKVVSRKELGENTLKLHAGERGGYGLCDGRIAQLRFRICGLRLRAGAVCRSWQYYRRLFLLFRISLPYRLLRR